MKLDYLHNINEYGDNIIRLYECDKTQSILFCEVLSQQLIKERKTLDLATVDFIESRNCTLVLRIAAEDLGITTEDEEHFFCDLTVTAYEKMLLLLAPFCKKETGSFQYLYDVDNPTDFLYSPGGTW